jgi:LysM repeat protein
MKCYVVKPGDTLSELAEKFNIPMHVLLFANPQIKSPDLIYVRQVIWVPEVIQNAN